MRGTPQQIIDKYTQLARDAQLSGDRVNAENFQQHAEHYTRLLGEAQREMEARREQQERDNQARQKERDQERAERQERESQTVSATPDPSEAPQPDVSEDSALVETAEDNAPKPKRKYTPRKKPAPKTDTADAGSEAAE